MKTLKYKDKEGNLQDLYETYKSGIIEEPEYVDLGLTSGNLWATCNIGAESPIEYGTKYAWGEIEPKEQYTWDNYKWHKGKNGSINQFSKYVTNPIYGEVDNKTTLDLEDDVAHVKYGSTWRIPTREDFEELQRECNCFEGELSGSYGIWCTSKKYPDKKIFFVTFNGGSNDSGDYQTSSLSDGTTQNSWDMGLNYDNWIFEFYYEYGSFGEIDLRTAGRLYGNAIRPVKYKS